MKLHNGLDSAISNRVASKMALHPINTADPANRNLIIDQYEKRGEAYVQAEFGVSRKAISRWRTLQRRTGSLAPHFSESGRKAALSPPEVRRLERALLADPYMTNADLAAVVGNKITPRAAGNYVKNSAHRFVEKLEQLDVESAFTQRHVEEGEAFKKKIVKVPKEKRIYVDETWIGAGVHRRKGRFPSGTPSWTPRNRKYPRKTVVSAINQEGFVHSSRIFNKGSITTADFEDYVKKDLAPHLREGYVVIWDQLGKSGRAKNPKAHHFSPAAHAAVAARGAKVVMLPSAGKLWNPIEIIFGEAKRLYEKDIIRRTKSRNPSKLTFQQLRNSWLKAEGQVSAATFAHAFKQRANGLEFDRVCAEKGLS